MNERLKEIRITLKMSQEEFGKWLGISKSGISDIESGRRKVTDQHVLMLCNNHNISEEWLRTGKGEMFIKLSRNDEIAKFVGELMKEEEDSFKNRLIAGLAALDDTGWDVLETFLTSIQPKKKD